VQGLDRSPLPLSGSAATWILAYAPALPDQGRFRLAPRRILLGAGLPGEDFTKPHEREKYASRGVY